MANEFIARKGLIVSGSAQVTGSLDVNAGITGSLLGTSSFATSASYASTSSVGLVAKAVDIIAGSIGTNLTQYTGSFTGSFTGSITSASYSTTASFVPNTSGIIYVVDGGGFALTTGIKGDLTIPFNCTINSWRLLTDQTGNITMDVWKDTYGNYPPIPTDSITGSAAISIVGDIKNESATLTGWTTNITAGDTLRFYVSSVSSITRATLTLNVTRS